MAVALLLALGAGGLGHAALAQSDAPGLALEVEDTGAFPSVTLAVTLPVAMLSEDGDAPDFSVTENGADVEVVSAQAESFTREPLDVVLLIDTSGSMAGEPLADAKTAARGFLQAIGPEDRVALVSFAFKPAVLAPFTADRAEVLSAIDGLAASGETAVHDAVVTAAGIARSSERRVAMVLLSDGGDTVSINSFDSAVSSVKDTGAPVFTVALESGEWDPAALGTLAAATGGRALSTADSGELPALYAGIARELGNRFRVTFTSNVPNTKDLEIGVRAARGQLSAVGSLALPNPQYAEYDAGAAPPLEPAHTGGWRPPLAVGLTFFAVIGLVGSIGMMLVRPRARLEQLEFYDQTRVARTAEEQAPGSPGAIKGRMLDAVGYVAGQRGFTALVHEKLERAGLPLRPVEYIYLHLIFVIIMGLLVGLGSGSVLIAMVVVLIAVIVPILLLDNAIERRRQRFEEQLPEVLNLVAGSLRAGWGMLQSIGLVVEQMAAPASTEFARVQTEARLGLPVEEALEGMAERLDSDDFRWTVAAIAIQREVGGNLAEVLDIVSATMRDRAELRRHIRSLTAEGRLSGTILILLPIVELGVLMLVNPSYMGAMFSHPFGWFLAIMGVALLLVGAVWLRRAMAVEV